MSKTGLEARKSTLWLLHAVLLEKRLLWDVLQDRSGALIHLTPADRARAQRLTLTILRNLNAIDHVINHFLDKKLPFAMLNILRLGTAELIIDHIPAHAVVDSAVSLAKQRSKTMHFKGLANAILRKIATHGEDIFSKQPVQKLPNSFYGQMKKIITKDEIIEIEKAHQAGARVDITCKDPSTIDYYKQTLNAIKLPNGSLRLREKSQISRLDGYQEGAWWVQDAAATFPVLAMGDLRGKYVLDLCAAPGGKTMQLAAAGADVVALDISQSRMLRLYENLKRTQLHAQCITANALTWEPKKPFDAILLDAPCSASGTIRRHPDLPFVKNNMDLKEVLSLQRNLLLRCQNWLKSNGMLIYSTCSLFSAEGEEQMKWLSKQNTHFHPVNIPIAPPNILSHMINDKGQMRLKPSFWTEYGGMDGFFIAKMHYNA